MVPLNLILIFGVLLYTELITRNDLSLDKLHKSLDQFANGLNLNGPPDSSDSAADSSTPNSNDDEDLNTLGYKISKGNVGFKFLNKKQRSGDRDAIVKQNRQTYEELTKQAINEPKDFDIESIRPPQDPSNYERANATILCLVRNQEALTILKAIKQLENSFNSKFNYPYTFINDQPFTNKFMEKMKALTSAEIHFTQVPPEMWDKPDTIDLELEQKGQKKLVAENVAYAQKASYHNMCRFYSKSFYKVPELLNYKYYWRLEPNIMFYNEINYDVFKYLQGTGKVYGFTMGLYDIEQSIATLWPETLKYLNTGDNYKYVNPSGSFQWLVEDLQNPHKNKCTGGYSTCHFWSNFEIGDFDFWRSEAYDNWVNYLDSTGKFYYERWGDAPVHSLGLSLFADKSKIHWFRDIGYYHDPYQHCPNTPTTKSCKLGSFCKYENLQDQNCMGTWIDNELGDPAKYY